MKKLLIVCITIFVAYGQEAELDELPAYQPQSADIITTQPTPQENIENIEPYHYKYCNKTETFAHDCIMGVACDKYITYPCIKKYGANYSEKQQKDAVVVVSCCGSTAENACLGAGCYYLVYGACGAPQCAAISLAALLSGVRCLQGIGALLFRDEYILELAEARQEQRARVLESGIRSGGHY